MKAGFPFVLRHLLPFVLRPVFPFVLRHLLPFVLRPVFPFVLRYRSTSALLYIRASGSCSCWREV
jgi:hypothetical protein